MLESGMCLTKCEYSNIHLEITLWSVVNIYAPDKHKNRVGQHKAKVCDPKQRLPIRSIWSEIFSSQIFSSQIFSSQNVCRSTELWLSIWLVMKSVQLSYFMAPTQLFVSCSNASEKTLGGALETWPYNCPWMGKDCCCTRSQLTVGMPSRCEGWFSTSSSICVVLMDTVKAFIRRVPTFTSTMWTQDYLNVCVCVCVLVTTLNPTHRCSWVSSWHWLALEF